MKIVIDISKEFEEDFKTDCFSDCMNRVITEIDFNLKNRNTCLLGNYEKEIFEMLSKALAESEKV